MRKSQALEMLTEVATATEWAIAVTEIIHGRAVLSPGEGEAVVDWVAEQLTDEDEDDVRPEPS